MNLNGKSTWSLPVRLAVGVGLTLCLLAPAQAESLLTTNGEFFAWPDTETPGLPGVYFETSGSRRSPGGTLAFRTTCTAPARRKSIAALSSPGVTRRPSRCGLAGTTPRRGFRASC
jgi:hypothetical protein